MTCQSSHAVTKPQTLPKILSKQLTRAYSSRMQYHAERKRIKGKQIIIALTIRCTLRKEQR